MNAAEFAALILVLALVAIPIYELYQNTRQIQISTTPANTTMFAPSKLANFDLSANPTPEPIAIWLSNGTHLVIEDRNPFKFEIIYPNTVSMPLTKIPEELPVYKAVTFNDTRELSLELKPLGLKAIEFKFNNKTSEYILNNSEVFFSYNKLNGKFSLILRRPLRTNPILFVQQSGLLTWDFIILNTTSRLSLVRLFHGFPSTVGIEVELVNGSITEVTGWIFKRIYLVSEYPVLQPQDISWFLEKRISGETVARDWYINTLAFTRAYIQSISLEYTETVDNYIVPTYMFSGRYTLDVDGVHRSGQLSGAILGILEKGG
ncbi:MAG: hypothetical protein F7B59_05925 [Desulfurococcales archaeon]|nr:hypothetical protein [Desulfurococcales archaeon]